MAKGSWEPVSRKEKEGKIRLTSTWIKTLWGEKIIYFCACTFPFAQAKARSRNAGVNAVHDEIQKGNGKETQRQSSESSRSRAARPIIFKLWSIVTCTARLCLHCDLVPAVPLDKAFQQISIKSYFQRFKTKKPTTTTTKSLIKKIALNKILVWYCTSWTISPSTFKWVYLGIIRCPFCVAFVSIVKCIWFQSLSIVFWVRKYIMCRNIKEAHTIQTMTFKLDEKQI